jgi:hypothetical protein
VHFTPTGQCLTQSAELVPYAQRDNVTTYFRTYNSQIESLQVKAAARGVATYLTINGVDYGKEFLGGASQTHTFIVVEAVAGGAPWPSSLQPSPSPFPDSPSPLPSPSPAPSP